MTNLAGAALHNFDEGRLVTTHAESEEGRFRRLRRTLTESTTDAGTLAL